jgi:hypothetical protein
MSPAEITCTGCQAPLPRESLNTAGFVACPSCGSLLQIEVFPAFLQGPAIGRTGENLMAEGESACFYHPHKRAAVLCEACGRFLCALCDCELNGQHLCPTCLESGKKQGKLRSLQNHRMLYDNLALALALFPLLIFYFTIVTAPMALFLAVRHWNAPSSLIPRSKIRFVLAIALSCLQIVGWIVGAGLLLRHVW